MYLLKRCLKILKILTGFTSTDKNFHNVSLGQGQEVVAEEAMSIAANSK